MNFTSTEINMISNDFDTESKLKIALLEEKLALAKIKEIEARIKIIKICQEQNIYDPLLYNIDNIIKNNTNHMNESFPKDDDKIKEDNKDIKNKNNEKNDNVTISNTEQNEKTKKIVYLFTRDNNNTENNEGSQKQFVRRQLKTSENSNSSSLNHIENDSNYTPIQRIIKNENKSEYQPTKLEEVFNGTSEEADIICTKIINIIGTNRKFVGNLHGILKLSKNTQGIKTIKGFVRAFPKLFWFKKAKNEYGKDDLIINLTPEALNIYNNKDKASVDI